MNLCSWNSHLQSTLSTHRSTMTQMNHRCLLNCRATISTLITSCRPFADPGSNNYAAVPVGSFPMQMGVPAGAFPRGTEARPMRKAGFMRGAVKEWRWDTRKLPGWDMKRVHADITDGKIGKCWLMQHTFLAMISWIVLHKWLRVLTVWEFIFCIVIKCFSL